MCICFVWLMIQMLHPSEEDLTRVRLLESWIRGLERAGLVLIKPDFDLNQMVQSSFESFNLNVLRNYFQPRFLLCLSFVFTFNSESFLPFYLDKLYLLSLSLSSLYNFTSAPPFPPVPVNFKATKSHWVHTKVWASLDHSGTTWRSLCIGIATTLKSSSEKSIAWRREVWTFIP